jgi:uncharacterized protein
LKILIDISHPAHVHLFRNLITKLKSNGHYVFVTAKSIPIVEQLLNAYNISFLNLGKKSDNIFRKGIDQIFYNKKIYKIVKRNNIELSIGTSISIAQVSRITKMKSLILDDDDDEVEPLFVKFGHRFSNTILSPDCINRKTNKNIPYKGYHELAYLHPSVFKPDPEVLQEVGLKKNEKFFILRFVAFKGHHDLNAKGFDLNQKKQLINLLLKYGKIFITSEREIESSLNKYRLSVSPEKIHSLLFYANAFFGDSQTMTSEAAILGTPALKYNTFAGKLSVPNELEEKYRLCYSYQPDQFDNFINKAKELLEIPTLKQEWEHRCQKMLQDKIDISAFLLWFVENYPISFQILKNNPNYT